MVNRSRPGVPGHPATKGTSSAGNTPSDSVSDGVFSLPHAGDVAARGFAPDGQSVVPSGIGDGIADSDAIRSGNPSLGLASPDESMASSDSGDGAADSNAIRRGNPSLGLASPDESTALADSVERDAASRVIERRHASIGSGGDDRSTMSSDLTRDAVSPGGIDLGNLPPDIDWHGEAAEIAAQHWRRTLWLVAVLMAIGFLVTFVPQFWAREWASMRFAGWPLPFYMGAQGSILIDIGLIVIYALMQRLNDSRYRKALHALRDARRTSLGLADDTLESAMARATSRSASSRAASAHIYR